MMCVNNMLAQASALGCPPTNGQPNAACLCGNQNFAYGLRDCTYQACGQTDGTAVEAYGASYCSGTMSSDAI
jgi:hypothetical protein